VFLAPDVKKIEDLAEAVRLEMAWKSIVDDAVKLDLTPFALDQAKAKAAEAAQTVEVRLPEAWCWMLYPEQPEATGPVEWRDMRLQGQGEGTLARRASRKLVNDDVIMVKIGALRLRHDLDRTLWRDHDHISIRQLWDYCCTYLYLPRIRDKHVLLDGIGGAFRGRLTDNEYFGYADAWDEAGKRYRGLRLQGDASVLMDGSSVLVKPEIARVQLEREQAPTTDGGTTYPPPVPDAGGRAVTEPGPPPRVLPKRFHGSIVLTTDRVGRDAGRIAEEVIQHLALLGNAKVEVTLEIAAEMPTGADETVQRTVTENCNTLKFRSHGFERD
jgi:uncharacterized protein